MVQTDSLTNCRVLAIGGPTASGKSALAIELAKRLNGAIVSADSMQIYRELSIGTAKPTMEERQGICHYMLDVTSCKQPFSVGDYVSEAKKAILQILEERKTPILVGGTGMYFSALLYGYNLGGVGKNIEVRKALEDRADVEGNESLYAELMQLAPNQAKKIHPNDRVRLVRALELAQTTGAVERDCGQTIPHLLYVLDGDRTYLYERINRRVEKMIDKGLVREVEDLVKQGVSADSQAMKAIGYKEILAYCRGEMDLGTAIEKLKQNTRRYAKRQLTYFRHMDQVNFVDYQSNLSIMCDIIAKKYKEFVKNE